jgi:hypothetical protein
MSVAARQRPAEAARIFAKAAGFLIKSLEKGTESINNQITLDDWTNFTRSSLVPVAMLLEPTEAARVLGQAVRMLEQELEKRGHSWRTRLSGAELLTVMVPRLERAEATRVLGNATHALKELLAEAEEATQRLKEAFAEVHANAVGIGATGFALRTLAETLAVVAGRLAPDDAVPMLEHAARVLTLALEENTDCNDRRLLAEGLAAVACRLTPAKAIKVCDPAVQMLKRAAEAEKLGWIRYNLEAGLVSVLQASDPALAGYHAKKLTFNLCSSLDANLALYVSQPPDYKDFPDILDDFLTDASRPALGHRAAAVATAIGLADRNSWGTVPALTRASDACQLSTQELVELLKMPTCFGKARQVVLKHLGKRYGRRFANHWVFVRYAKEQQLDLDFITPPKRPARP